MPNGFKERIACEVLIILGVLLLLCLITRLWPLLFLVVLGIIIAALRLLSVTAGKQTDSTPPVIVPLTPARPDTEQDVVRIAFGILQRRITEQVVSRYPSAKWVWELPNSVERLAQGLPLTILLNSAGGFGKAVVQVQGLRFCGLSYESVGDEKTAVPQGDDDGKSNPAPDGMADADGPVDYALIAFQWVEANMLALNDRCNSAIADGQETLLLPSCELPHADSWADICAELTRNGFAEAVIQPDGICVDLPK